MAIKIVDSPNKNVVVLRLPQTAGSTGLRWQLAVVLKVAPAEPYGGFWGSQPQAPLATATGGWRCRGKSWLRGESHGWRSDFWLIESLLVDRVTEKKLIISSDLASISLYPKSIFVYKCMNVRVCI